MTRRRRQPPQPDTRPRWDDPDLRMYGTKSGLGYPEHIISKLCAEQMARPSLVKLHWRNDPTYNMRRRPIRND